MSLPLQNIKKIAVFRALQLGDMLCVIPAIRSLRKAYPHAEITLLGLPWAQSFVARFNQYFERFIHFPGCEGLPEQDYDEEVLHAFIKQMKKEKFDLVLQMQGNGTIVNPLMFLFDAKHVAGFYNAESYVASDLFLEYPNHGSEIERHIALMNHLGIKSTNTELEFPLTEKDYRDYAALLIPITEKKYVIVHPGSRGSYRQWPPQFFAVLADYCIEQGFTVVVTGTEDEKLITQELVKRMRHAAIDLTGKTNLGAVTVLIQNAFMLIANCTGVSHIASALKTPSVIISMDGEPGRWAPLNKQLHRTIDWTKDPHFKLVFNETVALIQSLKQAQVHLTAHHYILII
ncbi:MAG TPA: glycosyltransferase family 9 protein [Parafilimonas sp.]|nr:glycosyltransferase family 9 protein [Parafilimonas sp.]